jgi:hypothetical protein
MAAVLVLALLGYGADLAADRTVDVAEGAPGLPSQVFDPPVWTEGLDNATTGPAAVAFWGPTVAEEPFTTLSSASVALVGLDRDTYRVLYPTQAPPVLSPDGRTVLLAQLDLGGAGSMTADSWRTDALDLVTGQRRTVATRAVPVSWSVDGRHLLLVKPYYWPDAPTPGTFADLVSVVGWPSAQLEWSVRVSRPEALEGESHYYLALSPDASGLAVTTSGQLRVYGRDGAVQWQRDSGTDILAGPAAWREDGRLAVMRCVGCPRPSWFDPTDWRLEFVDATTGAPVPTPDYPVVSAVPTLRTVAWRGDTAYVVAGSRLLSLTPGVAASATALSMPPDVNGFTVATNYVDTIRPAGSPAFGFTLLPMLSMALDGLKVAAILAAGLFLLWWWRRRRIEHTRIPPAP